MKRGWWLLLVLWLATGCAVRPLPTQRQATEGRAEQARWLLAAVLDAWRTQDTPRLEAYLAPETPHAAVPNVARSRAEWLAWLGAHAAECDTSEAAATWAHAPLLPAQGSAALAAGFAERDDWLLVYAPQGAAARFVFVLHPDTRGWRLSAVASIPNPPLN